MSIYLSAWMLPALMLFIFLGFPVAFSLIGTALIFGLIRFGDIAVFQYVSKVHDIAGNYVLAAVPLFILMGTILERSGIAERLFEGIHLWTRNLPGGLAITTILMCVVFAAATGVVGASESVVGLLAIPAMLRFGYDKGLISGTICAGGSLGTIIPPSVLVVILAPVASIDLGALFVGIMIPGILLAAVYIIYILVLSTVAPKNAPLPAVDEDEPPFLEKLAVTLRALVPPVCLVVAVLGSIMFGLATPTEAAAVGAFGALLLVALYGRLDFTVIREALRNTILVTAMIMTIVLAGTMFSGVFVAAGGMVLIQNTLETLHLTGWQVLALILLITFVAGFVLEFFSIILIIVPISVELMDIYGFDKIWFSVLFLIILQTSYLTPPMAPAIFFMRGISPPEITLRDMYRGVTPFIALHFVVLAAVVLFPGLATWLPELFLGPN